MMTADLVKEPDLKNQSICRDFLEAIQTQKLSDSKNASNNDNEPELIQALRGWINE
jgi:hypothetical protein